MNVTRYIRWHGGRKFSEFFLELLFFFLKKAMTATTKNKRRKGRIRRKKGGENVQLLQRRKGN